MIDSVKAVAPNSLGQPFVRTGIHGCGVGQSAVKAGVEHRYLRNIAKVLFDDCDSFEFGSIMEGRKNGHARDCGFHFWRDEDRLFEILAAVDDAMTYNVDFRGRRNDARIS